ncbi:MAG: 4Fe-4S binding protein [Gammaproteobacteria bacterium]
MTPFPIPVKVEQTATGPKQGSVAAQVEHAAARLRPWLPWVHAFMFVAFLALLLGPVLLPASPTATRLAAFSNWLIWGLWFPLVFLSVLVSGRSWCGVLCPMGAASQWMNRIGLKRPVPAWLRWEGTPILSFVLITILGQTVGVRDYPGALLEVFGGTLLAALLIGFLMIDINRKTESRHCVMCMRCVQPGRRGGLGLRLRAPGAEVAEIQHHHPAVSELWFLLLGTGVALGGFLWLVLPEYQWLRQHIGVWAINHGMYWIGNPGPGWLMVNHPGSREVFVWLDFFLIVGWMLAIMLAFTLVLGTLNAAAAWLAGKLGAGGGFHARFVALGYQFAPVAMVSLLLGLGGELFADLPGQWAVTIKLVLLAGALLWGIDLGRRILAGQGLRGVHAAIVLLPGTTGALAVAAAWWPALAGS